MRWSLETLRGEVLRSGQEGVAAAPFASTAVCALDLTGPVSAANSRELVFIVELWRENRRLALAVAVFVPDKYLLLADPELQVDLRQEGDQLFFVLQAGSLARFAELALAGVDVVFSDNYFDLPAGRTVNVTCPVPPGWTLERARQALRVRSLYDSFT